METIHPQDQHTAAGNIALDRHIERLRQQLAAQRERLRRLLPASALDLVSEFEGTVISFEKSRRAHEEAGSHAALERYSDYQSVEVDRLLGTLESRLSADDYALAVAAVSAAREETLSHRVAVEEALVEGLVAHFPGLGPAIRAVALHVYPPMGYGCADNCQHPYPDCGVMAPEE